ncbi:MAG: glycosyltransferase [Parvularculaceae bacterium]
MKGSLLIIARHFPPAVSGGARRPLLLAEGLRARGWKVTIASPAAPNGYPHWIETPHPAGLRGETAVAQGPTNPIEGLKIRVRGALYWPDGDMRWAFSADAAVRRADVRPDWVLTTSPPESAHLAGYLVKSRTGARWLAEMRDSWIDEPLRPELRDSALRRGIERRLAKTLLRRADRIVAVSPSIADEATRLAGRPATVIGHFARAPISSYEFSAPGPHLVHAGRFTLSHRDRRIEALLADFEIAAADLPPTARLHLIGLLTEDERNAVARNPRAAQIVGHGEKPYDQALAMQQAADGLILQQPAIAALPGKFSEYLLMTAPILIVGDGEWTRRLGAAPHFRLTDARKAMAAPRRQPQDALGPALDAYERILGAPV